jgi:hypothetical protein
MRLFVVFMSLLSLATAQFGFFDQMFGGHDGHEHQHHHHQQEQQNNPSDANHYKSQYEQCTLLLNMAIGNSDTPGGVPGILTVH